MKKYETQLESAYNEYISKIEKIAEEARRDYLIPYLEKNKYNFYSGNGTYVISDPSNEYDYYQNIMFNLPKRIEKILQLDVSDRSNPELGLWMSDYKSVKD